MIYVVVGAVIHNIPAPHNQFVAAANSAFPSLLAPFALPSSFAQGVAGPPGGMTNNDISLKMLQQRQQQLNSLPLDALPDMTINGILLNMLLQQQQQQQPLVAQQSQLPPPRVYPPRLKSLALHYSNINNHLSAAAATTTHHESSSAEEEKNC